MKCKSTSPRKGFIISEIERIKKLPTEYEVKILKVCKQDKLWVLEYTQKEIACPVGGLD